MKDNPLKTKSFAFAVRIVGLYKYLRQTKSELVIAKQIVRSGTCVGALVREAEHAESLKDFIHKLNIALKEANETAYWLDLLCTTQYISQAMYTSINNDCIELLKLLTASVKTAKLRLPD